MKHSQQLEEVVTIVGLIAVFLLLALVPDWSETFETFLRVTAHSMGYYR